MAGETVITVVGNLTSDPDFRFTPSGAAVVNFTIASTPRTFDRQTNEWKDGEALFLRATAWRDMAENIAESLKKGTRVVASGRLKSRSYETKEGERRTSMELDIDEIGPSLRYATTAVSKKTQQSGGEFSPAAPKSFAASSPAAADPWATPQGGNSQTQSGWGTVPDNEEPPF